MLSESDQQQLDRVLVLVRDVLGSDAVGAYLFGSAVLGGLRPESDLDVLVVAKRPTTYAEKEHLVTCLLSMSGRNTPDGVWRRVELTIVVGRDVIPWRYPPRFDFQYGDWLRSDFESGNIEPWPTKVDPDLALLISMVILGDTPLFGPPPNQLFEPVPFDDTLRAMVGDLDRLRSEIESDTRNVILTLARIWSTLETGVIRSKDDAADWALGRLPAIHRPLLARARAIYLADREEGWGDVKECLAPLAECMVVEIKALLKEVHQ